VGEAISVGRQLHEEAPLLRAGVGAGTVEVHHLVGDRTRRPDEQPRQIVDGRWGPVHRRAAVLVGIDDVEERVAKDGLDGCERLLAGSWLAPEYLPHWARAFSTVRSR